MRESETLGGNEGATPIVETPVTQTPERKLKPLPEVFHTRMRQKVVLVEINGRKYYRNGTTYYIPQIDQHTGEITSLHIAPLPLEKVRYVNVDNPGVVTLTEATRKKIEDVSLGGRPYRRDIVNGTYYKKVRLPGMVSWQIVPLPFDPDIE